MNEKNKATFRKTLTLSYLAVGAFTAISFVAPILLDRLWKRTRH
jgi:hypothetical protein